MNAEQDGLNKDPSVPQGLPTGKTVALASEKAAKAGNGTAETADRPLHLGMRIQQGDDVDDLLGNDLCGRQIGCQTRQVSQPEQAHPNGCQDGQQVFKRADGMHAAIFQAAAIFEDFMKLFDEPTTAIPARPFPGILDRENRHARQQNPFKRLDPIRRQRLPDAHHPQEQFCLRKAVALWMGG